MHQCSSDDLVYRGLLDSQIGIWVVKEDQESGTLKRGCLKCVGDEEVNKLSLLVRELERYPGDDQYVFNGALVSRGKIVPIITYAEDTFTSFNIVGNVSPKIDDAINKYLDAGGDSMWLTFMTAINGMQKSPFEVTCDESNNVPEAIDRNELWVTITFDASFWP